MGRRTESVLGLAPQLGDVLDRTHTRLHAGDVAAGMWELTSELARVRAALAPADWKKIIQRIVRTHSLADTILASPLARRAQFGRRAGTDAILMDMMYGTHEAADCGALGEAIYAFERELPTIAGVRSASAQIRDALLHFATERCGPRVLVLRCRHLRELDVTALARLGEDAQVVAVDPDPDCIASIRRRLLDPRVHAVCAEPHEFATRVNRTCRRFDFIYQIVPSAMGWATASRIALPAAFSLLRPGGTLLFAAAAAGRHDAGYLEAILELWLPGGGEGHMTRVVSGIAECAESAIYRDPHGGLLFARLVRRR